MSTECTALVLITPRRPRALKVNAYGGGAPAEVDIAVHDAWFLAKKRQFKRRIFAMAPDRNDGKGKAPYRELLKQYSLFLMEQRWWYEHWGMLPPKHEHVRYTDSASYTRTRVQRTGYRPCAATRIQGSRTRKRSTKQDD